MKKGLTSEPSHNHKKPVPHHLTAIICAKQCLVEVRYAWQQVILDNLCRNSTYVSWIDHP